MSTLVVTVTKRAIIDEMHDEGGWNFTEIADHLGVSYFDIQDTYRRSRKKKQKIRTKEQNLVDKDLAA